MKSLSKKLLVALLSVGMVVTMIPFTAFPAEAATNLDGGFEGQDSDVFTALGFDTSELPEDYDPDTADNPYGRDTITGNQVFELAVAGGSGSTVYGDGDNEVQGTGISGTPGGTGVGMDMSAAAAGDFDGDGLPGEIVYVGYGSGIKKPAYNSSTDTITSDVELADLDLQIYNGKTKTYGSMKRVGGVNAYYTAGPKKKSIAKDPASVASQREENWLNLLQVTAGDYDGDGISEIAVYVGENGSPRVDIYKYQKTSTSSEGDWIDMENNWARVWSHALSGACVPNMVSLVSGDFNRDGIDDLGISYGITTFELESVMLSPGYMEASRAVMLWGDRSNMLQTSSPIDLAEGDLGEQTRVSLIKGDLNQDGTPELIATGHPMANIIQGDEFVNLKINNNFYQVVLYSRGNAQRTAISYLYDQENGLTVDSSNLLEPVKGKFETSGSGDTEMTAWTSENGFDYAYYSSPYMRTNATVFQPQGAEYPYLYLDSCLYQAVEGKTNADPARLAAQVVGIHNGRAILKVYNTISTNTVLEYVAPNLRITPVGRIELFGKDGSPLDKARHIDDVTAIFYDRDGNIIPTEQFDILRMEATF